MVHPSHDHCISQPNNFRGLRRILRTSRNSSPPCTTQLRCSVIHISPVVIWTLKKLETSFSTFTGTTSWFSGLQLAHICQASRMLWKRFAVQVPIPSTYAAISAELDRMLLALQCDVFHNMACDVSEYTWPTSLADELCRWEMVFATYSQLVGPNSGWPPF